MSMLDRGEKRGNRWIFLWLLNSLGGLDMNTGSYSGFNAFTDEIIHHYFVEKDFD